MNISGKKILNTFKTISGSIKLKLFLAVICLQGSFTFWENQN